MPYSVLWLPEVLGAAGLKVATVDGWQYRGDGDMGTVMGVICHHTAGARTLNMPSLNTLIHGRSDLPGPLSHLGLGRDGTFYVIAAGRCNHAGRGCWQGISSGNTHFLGIEAENTGLPGDPWPAVQMEAYRVGVAAILRKIGQPADFCAGHKEYALPRGRKDDPSFDMAAFRAALAGTTAADQPAAIAPAAPPAADGTPGRETLRRGDHGPLVLALQRAISVAPADGVFGPGTEAAVRSWQRTRHLVPDGIVGPGTWQTIP